MTDFLNSYENNVKDTAEYILNVMVARARTYEYEEYQFINSVTKYFQKNYKAMMNKIMYKEFYKKGEEFLKSLAKDNDWKYYTIVEDNSKYDYGLTIIAYENEESMLGTTSNIEEICNVTINLLNYMKDEEDND